jgi:hypothetical protein
MSVKIFSHTGSMICGWPCPLKAHCSHLFAALGNYIITCHKFHQLCELHKSHRFWVEGSVGRIKVFLYKIVLVLQRCLSNVRNKSEDHGVLLKVRKCAFYCAAVLEVANESTVRSPCFSTSMSVHSWCLI